MTRAFRVGLFACLALGAAATGAQAGQVWANLFLATPDGKGAAVGSAIIRDGADGARFKMNLHGLPPGQHGFHVHSKGSCDPTMKDGMPVPAGGAGGHHDPDLTGRHEGPLGRGHMGDLPALTVAADGTDTETLTAPRIHDVSTLKGHSLMIHAGGDTYSDKPDPLGGGGARIACGMID
jgi:Cu-Zn family superoxide dismutase